MKYQASFRAKTYIFTGENNIFLFTACDQSIVESGVTEGGKNTARFFFLWINTTTQTWKTQAKKV